MSAIQTKYNANGHYNAGTITLNDGDEIGAQYDINGNHLVGLGSLLFGEDSTNSLIATMQKPVVTATYTPSIYISAGVVTANIKGSAGNLYSLQATNLNAAIRYVQFFNTATTPAGGATAILTFQIPAGSATVPGIVLLGRDILGANGINFATGIAFGFSTAAATYTAATAADCFITGTFL